MNRRAAVQAVHAQRHKLMDRLGKRMRRADVEDLLQDTYVRILQSSRDIREPAYYAYTVAKHLIWEHGQHKAPRNDPLALAQLLDHSATPQEELEREQTIGEILALIAHLSPKCQRIFEMHALEEYTYSEIATQFHLSESMIKKYLTQAKGRLRHDRHRPDRHPRGPARLKAGRAKA